jgi:hypothetical protein
MAVNLSPQNQLGFPRPLTQIVKRSLLIHNPNPQPVAFKVKTTAPKQYCVRPNQGRVEPGENVEVQSKSTDPGGRKLGRAASSGRPASPARTAQCFSLTHLSCSAGPRCRPSPPRQVQGQVPRAVGVYPP